jgi:lysozyme
MIYTGTLLRAELYDDHVKPYTNVKAVYDAHQNKRPGKLIVTNAHWYNTKPVAPVGNYKAGGTVISQQYDHALNLVWSGDTRPVWSWDMNEDNAIGTIPALVNGVRQDVSKQDEGVQRSTLRTWWGFDVNGKCTIEATTTNYTLDAIIDRMQSLGIVDGVVLDGGGSSQCYDGAVYQHGDWRYIYSYLLLWFAEDGGTDKEEDDTTATTCKRGIDVSEWQKTIDWEKVKAAGIDFAMIKAGSGRNRIDPQFKYNISECNRLDIPCGVYWFSYAYTEELAHNEAKYCLEAIAPYKVDYPVAYDFEYDSVGNAEKVGVKITKEMASSFARAFLGDIEAAKYYAMLYTNADYLSRYFDAELAKRYDVWLAKWPANPDPNKKPPEAGGIWQYSNTGSVDGISVRVDLDAAYYDYPGIIEKNGLNQPAAAPEPKPELSEAELARAWAMERGISDGENPDSPATRGQVWTMLYRMEGGEKDD